MFSQFNIGTSMRYRILDFIDIKHCPCCNKLYYKDNFCNNRNTANKKNTYCRFCSHYIQIWNLKTRDYKLKSDRNRVEKRKKYREENLVRVKSTSKRWRTENKDYIRFLNATRRAAKKQATPKWADLEAIAKIYRECPEEHHVDHIIPLTNDLVCGLHVHNNLRIVTKLENLSKKNKFNIGGLLDESYT